MTISFGLLYVFCVFCEGLSICVYASVLFGFKGGNVGFDCINSSINDRSH